MIDFDVRFVGMEQTLLAPNQGDHGNQRGRTWAPRTKKGFDNENRYTTIASIISRATTAIEELGMSKETKGETP